MKRPAEILDPETRRQIESVYKQFSPLAKQWIDAGEASVRLKEYYFIKILSGLSGIQKLFLDSQVKSVGITNIEKSKFDSDVVLLGVGAQVGYNASSITDTTIQDYTRMLMSQGAMQPDTDSTVTQFFQRGRGVTTAGLANVDIAIRNAEIHFNAGGTEIFTTRGQNLFIDGQNNNLGLEGDFANYLQISPLRVVSSDKAVQPTIELPNAVGNYYALMLCYYVAEVFQSK